MNGVNDEMRFHIAAKNHAPHIADFDPDRIVGVCHFGFRSHGDDWYSGNDASLSSDLRHMAISSPNPIPPNTNRKIDLNPRSPQRMLGSMID